jgi:hypothetical protein
MTIKGRIKVKLTGYVRLNWGAPFIIAFMVLVLSAAVSLSIGLSSLANTLAIAAFYGLVVGVILQLLCYVKCQKIQQTGAP